MENAIGFIFPLAILIFSVVIHEVSHGYAALALGDETARYSGRLTLNPLKHIDPFGSIFLPLLMYIVGGPILGWAKPVPYNPRNLQNQKWGPAIVGAAGPCANIFLAIIFGLIVRFLPNATSALPGSFIYNFIMIAGMVAFLNLVLAVFNLVPIPPLDGSKILFAVLPYKWRWIEQTLEQYGIFVLLIFIFFFAQWLSPVVSLLFKIITGSLPFF